MPAEPTSRDTHRDRDSNVSEREGMTLTDFFDQMDRAAFRRSLEHRDNAALETGEQTSR